jgi:carboxypeptidase C (cathepsin A)
MMKCISAAVIAASLTLAQIAFAQAPATPPANAPNRSEPRAAPGEGIRPLPADSTTSHTITLPDRTLKFSATAGAIRLSDAESGAPRADVAFIAFRKDGADVKTRPVAFVFNGGPGYASGWLNLGGLGPWRLPMSGDATRPSASPAVVDNAETWLDFTDLVFLDPPGVGYSRVIGGDDVRKSFWSVTGDAGALATAIRRWSEANDRSLSPKYIVGESYGGFRAPKIANILQKDQGIGVNGLVLVSPVLDFASFNASSSPLGLVARLPSMAATIRERKGRITRESMKDVEDYAIGGYLSDLLKGPNDAEAVTRLTDRVTELTGLERSTVRDLGGRVSTDLFAREVNRATKRISSMYDGNITGLDPTPFADSNSSEDQLRVGLHAPITQAMVDIYRHRLNWVVENGRYNFFNQQAGRQWDYGARRAPESVSDLREVLALDPGMRVLVAHGLTDLVTPYFESKMTLDQIALVGPPGRLKLQVYPGGHMVYIRDDTRKLLREDARFLVEGK